MSSLDHHSLIKALHYELNIPEDYARRTGLSLHPEVPLSELIVAQLDDAGRPLVLTKPATQALHAMQRAARRDGVVLSPFSGFRSYIYQRGLLLAKIRKGVAIDEILKVLAAPGYSEHHTGEAIDITTTDCPPAEVSFQGTAAYQWLVIHAKSFGFRESFPKDNAYGIMYEPWHWKFSAV